MNNVIDTNETEIQVANIDTIETNITLARSALKELTDKRMALLPALSLSERKILEEHAEAIGSTEAGATVAAELLKERRLSEEDKDQLACAKIRHRILANAPAGKTSAAFLVAKARLTSYKLIHRVDGRVGVRLSGLCG